MAHAQPPYIGIRDDGNTVLTQSVKLFSNKSDQANKDKQGAGAAKPSLARAHPTKYKTKARPYCGNGFRRLISQFAQSERRGRNAR